MAKHNKTVHVVPSGDGWAVRGESGKDSTFSTQADAIKAASHIVRDSVAGQFVVLRHDGKIVKHVTHGLPKVQDPPGKRGGKKKIQNAVGRVALERFNADPHPARG
ncbi:MAG: DUF2188 domain-containing protein [Candidatus Solibacter sp.]